MFDNFRGKEPVLLWEHGQASKHNVDLGMLSKVKLSSECALVQSSLAAT